LQQQKKENTNMAGIWNLKFTIRIMETNYELCT
jgi:hypothetical protein